jgi:acyl carrier protein
VNPEPVVRAFLRTELWQGEESEFQIGADQSLIATGILDSLALLKLILFLEERFAIKIADGEVTPAHFETIDRITEYLEAKTSRTTRV